LFLMSLFLLKFMRRKYRTQKELIQSIFGLRILSVVDEGAEGGGSAPEAEAPVEQPELVPDDTAPEVVVDEPNADDAEAPKEDAPDGDVPEEDAVEVKADEVAPVTFDATAELPALKEEIAKTLDGYEIPQPIQAVIDALTAKAEAVPVAPQFAEYGEPDAIVETLDTHSKLYSQRLENGAPRRNTDQYVESIKDPEVKSDLFKDLSATASEKYKGFSLFEEAIAETFGREGEPIGAALKRYQENINAVVNGSIVPSSDVPEWIPVNCIEAFKSLPLSERNEIALYAPENDNITYDENGKPLNPDATTRANKLQILAKLQEGLENDRRVYQNTLETAQLKTQNFNKQVNETVDTYYGALREKFAKELSEKAMFSPDPKLNAFYAVQQVSAFELAVKPEGQFYRDQLIESGIKFDYLKVQALDAALVSAITTFTSAKGNVDKDGNQLDKVGLSKAESAVAKASKDWQDFETDIIEQQKKLVSTKTDEAVKEAAKKIPVKAKPRATANGAGSEMKHRPDENPHPYNSYAWHEWLVDRDLKAANAIRQSAAANGA